MDEHRDPDGARTDRRELVVVPHRPGPLVVLDGAQNQRGRDDLDDLIDDLLPEIEDRPGWFDAALVVLGAGLLAWAWIGSASAVVPVLGGLSLALGCILPLRAAWRRARLRRDSRRRKDLLEKGVPIDVSSPPTARLVAAYEDLLTLANQAGREQGDPAIGAAHSALMEVASLLKGRTPTSERELGYVDRRAVAVADLVSALRQLPSPEAEPSDDELPALDADAIVEAREELDQIAPVNSVSRLEELIAEAKIQGRGRS